MNPLAHYARVVADAYGDWVAAPDAPAVTAPEPEPEPAVVEPAVPPTTPAPNGWRSSVYAELRPGGVPEWKTDWQVSDEDGLHEWLEMADLSDLTAAVGPWEAARTLFAPEGSCAGLYATQTPEPCPSRVSVSLDAHRPAQPRT